MVQHTKRVLAGAALGVILTLGAAGAAFAYEDVYIPPAACDSVQDGIANFHDSPAPGHMQQTPAWGSTSRFVYDNC